MFVGIGVGIGRNRFAQGIFNAYNLRVVADGGITEAGNCVDAVSSLLQSASLLLIPSGYKGGKLYAEIPTNGNGDLTWTRGSDAFRTNASGLLQRVPWNLLRYSEEFDNGAWTKSSATVTANATTAPNGTLTADKVIANNTASTTRAIYQSFTPSSAQRFNFSVYAKASEYSRLALQEIGSGRFGASFDLSAQTTASLGGAGFVSSSITNVGNGWFLCSVVWDGVGGSGAALTTIGYPAGATISAAGTSYAGDGTSGIFIWGAQLVEGTTAQTYLPTTDRLNFPRLSYMYGSCPSALLEPQRTNLALWSEDFTNAVWSKTAVTVTGNTTTSPDGNTTADTISATASTGQHLVQNGSHVATTNTASIYAKKGTHKFFQIFSGANSQAYANFDLDSGVVGTLGTISTSSIQNVGNGWYRCTMTFTATSNSIFRWALVSSASAAFSESWAATGSENLYLWGAQAELGAYPTTYIPTTSATATRVADSFSRSNIYTNGLISASGGTWFVELRGNVSYVRDSVAVNLFLGDNISSPSNALVIRSASASATRLSIQKVIAGAFTILATPSTDTIKVAFKWNGTSADVFVNGTKEVSATAFTTTNMEFLACISQITTFIQQMALFPTPLTDAQCQTITTL